MGGSPSCPPTHGSPLAQLQKSKEREEQLEEMIQAYEKLCVEKADLETELREMVRAGGTLRGPLPLTPAGQIP